MFNRSKVEPMVVWIQSQAADDLGVEPEEPRAGFVAHRRRQDAGLYRGTVRFCMNGELDFIRGIAELSCHQVNMCAVVESLDAENHVKPFHARRRLRQLAWFHGHLRLNVSRCPDAFARHPIQSAEFQFAETPSPCDDWFDGDEVDKVIPAAIQHGGEQADQSTRSCLILGGKRGDFGFIRRHAACPFLLVRRGEC